MNVRGNILIIWRGGSPISKHPHFDTQSPSLFPPSLPSILWFHHLISHPSCHRDLLNPPTTTTTLPPPPSQYTSLSSSFSLSPSLKCHLHFSVHILRLQLPVDGLIFLALATTSTAHGACCSLKQLMTRPVCVCPSACVW